MIRDCSYYSRRAEILERLAEIAESIAREDAVQDALFALAVKHGKAWTDPRNGVTYFPPRRAKQ